MKYFMLIWKHKWFVLLAGLKTKAPPWRLIIHDWSKFLPSELPAYQRQFFGPKELQCPEQFIACWTMHQNRHPHHWEYWIPRTGHNRCTPPLPDNEPIPMPMWAVREMVADWMGASRAYDGKWPSYQRWPWFDNNFAKISGRLHGVTYARVLLVLKEVGLWRNK